ncbi:hypothetical protein [Flavobacterium sp.]|uniref:hypothetical protein n=1 Tax=Flavobacterium sp. TaxID=239 RepID=UPI0011F81060|nr:hypothetical protein [Flavobacterium sp.]RZJ69149.1 MAG: hypothetical protein EOO49_18445 [Flavobacterium sp.]
MKNCLSQIRASGKKAVSGEFFSFLNFWGYQVAFLVQPQGIFGSFVARQKNSPPDRRRKTTSGSAAAANLK